MNKSSDPIFEEKTLQALKVLEANASVTQRELSRDLDLSLGKINFILKSLMEKGFIKVERFKNSRKKSAYLYYLTPDGFEQKLKLTRNFLQRKMREYEVIRGEIEGLKKDLESA